MRILRFTAEWCQPCKALQKNIENTKIDIPIEVYDVDENMDIATEYGIRTIPTMILLDGNNEIKRVNGVLSSKELENWIKT